MDRSSHTQSPDPPLSMEAQPIASASSKCNATDLPETEAVTGTRSWGLEAGSRASQYALHTVASAAAAAGDVPPAANEDSVAMSTNSAAEVDLCDFM